VGKVFTWGEGKYGALGHGDEISRPKPEEVDLSSKRVTEVACGLHHTVFLACNLLELSIS